LFWLLHRRKTTISTDPAGLRIDIRYWLGWPTFFFLIFWTYMNIQFGLDTWTNISRGIVGPRTFDRLHISEIFSILGILMCLWMALGRESITISAERMQIRRGILGLGWSKRFPLSEVRDLRSGWFLDPRARGNWDPDHVTAALYFNYEGGICCFGRELTDSRALQIEEVIRKSFPQIVLNRG
jgi:hypothetical protein